MQDKPLKLDLPGIVHIVAGANHVLALAQDHCIWAWGCGEQGQLGRRVLERHKKSSLAPYNITPKRRGYSPSFTSFSCGSYHTLAVDGEGRVWTWGLNNFGQLGLGDNFDRIVPEMIDPSQFNNEPVVMTSAGEHHSLVLTKSGNVYAFGRGDSCQLGVDGCKSSRIPVKVSVLQNVSSIASGSNHNLAVTADNRLFSWGFGEMLQLGNGKEEDEPVPKFIAQYKKIYSAKGGGQHSILLAEE